MTKDDVKTIILIFFLLLLISAIAILGVRFYNNIIKQGVVGEEQKLYDGNATINPSENTVISNIDSDNLNEIQGIKYNETILQEDYYYQQLNSYSKSIYDKIKENKENMKSGTYKIEFGDSFKEILSQENGAQILQQYYQSAIETYLYDNPDIFYLDANKMYINIYTTKRLFSVTYDVFIDSGDNENYLLDEYKSRQEIIDAENLINLEVQKILNQLKNQNDYQKILTVHDYLVDNVSYEETVSKENIYNIVGAIVNKEAVCEGYAKAFKYLMDQIGIESIIITGVATDSKGKVENHAWNYVKLENNWYAVDVTWDDPIAIGGGFLGKRYKYRYFLKGSETMNSDHTEECNFIDNGNIYNHPTLSVKDYK